MTQSKQVVRERAADIRRQQTRLPASKQAPLNVPFVNSALRVCICKMCNKESVTMFDFCLLYFTSHTGIPSQIMF